MDKRGQFSIIAALLVAVILIATVIITYSTIRNLPVGEQPQVLSAIDETNLALKQILGFTMGYYGSILQVTGDRDYANDSAYKYLMSGLDYIARMHPERAVSFELKEVNLQTYWFASQSYSTGKIAVKYDLAGLGIYGITYEPSCKLSVNITGTDDNQARVRVTVDEEDEPLINLGKTNFKFYRYIYSNSTWELVNPSNEPTAFANGTYLIDIPSEIDRYSYLVQVEDQRGIVTVASSFSRYICTLTWNPNATLIDRESFEGSWPPSGWTATGNWNKENDQAYIGTYSAVFDGQGSGDLTTPDLNCTGAASIYVDFWYRDEGCSVGEFLLQYYDGTAWRTIADLGSTTLENQWLHYQQRVTDGQYFKPNFKIRWATVGIAGNKHAYVDYVTVKKEIGLPAQSEPIVVELLQNGTMRWLGQNLNMATQAKPIPPIPVKAIRVNQTINGVDCEVPFQIEDWASDYHIPLGLANNASVFNNRNMIVFLVNRNVSKVTIWWNGSDAATQTSLAYANRYFNDNPSARTLRNGKLTLQLSSSGFTVTATATGGMSSTARLMRVNGRYDTTDPEWAYTIINGVVRDIVHGESEYSGGVTDPQCYNFYSHIVITLPANATYYTYQLRLIFLNSADKPRTIRDICLVSVSTTGTGFSALTENGTSTSGYPIVSTAPSLFYNMSGIWQHHWSQLNSSETRGFGIMFPDASNKKLYYFDSIVNSQTGALNISSTGRTIEFLPVKLVEVSNFVSPLDICWYGAVVTFDGTTPIYKKEGSNITGLWILAEYPPSITVTTES